MCYALFCCAALFLPAAQAQPSPSVNGAVVDPSARPVPGARVECAGRTATTGLDGRFTFPGIGRCEAAISARGFETKSLTLVSGAETRIELAIAGLSQMVIVSATRHETSLEMSGAAASVVTREDLEALGFPPLGEALRGVPGLEIAQYGRPGSLTQIYSRGGQRTATLLMIDGVPVNDPGGEVNLAGLATDPVERIEVVRGPESALFGAEAASGVVQLFTARGDPEDRVPHGSVSYERGSFQTDRWTASLAGGSGARFDYSLTAAQIHTVGEYPNDYFRNTSGAANAGFRLGASTALRAVYRTYDFVLGTPNQVGFGIYDLNANEATRDSLISLRLDDARGSRYTQRVSFGYHRSHDLYLDGGADGPYDIAALVRDSGGRTYFEALADPLAPVPSGMRLVTYSAYLWAMDPFLSLSSRTDFGYQGTLAHAGGAAVFGYEYERQSAEIAGPGRVGRDNHAVFLHEQKAVGRLSLSGGLRLEQNSAFHTRVTPRAAASLRLAPSTFLHASAGIGITDPSLLQNFARDPYYTGNLSLRPEKTLSCDAGLTREWLGRRLRTEVTAFANSFRDLIVFVSMPLPTPSTWQNVEASRARGLEFSAQARPASWLAAAASYTRMWTRITRSSTPNSLFTGVGQELIHRPSNAGAVSLSITPRRWMIETGAVLTGERQEQDYIFGVSRIAGYQSVHASASYRLNRNLRPFIRIENLLDSHYEEVLGYPAPARGIHGGLRVEW
jgi:vitamin B12 transporter